jgi:hypothetical protein
MNGTLTGPELAVDYDEPPVLVINDGERHLNGTWVDGRARFTDLVNGPLYVHTTRLWLWLTSGEARPVDITMMTATVMPLDTLTVTVALPCTPENVDSPNLDSTTPIPSFTPENVEGP